MDGTLAAIFLVASLTDMALTDCKTGCLAPAQDATRLTFQVAQIDFNKMQVGHEVMVGYDYGTSYGPFQPTFGAALSDMGDVWIGAGAKWTTQDLIDGPLFVEASLMPGYFKRGDGPDIGGALQFRSALGLGYEFSNGVTLLAAYDHRSNADTQKLNPGLETISLRIAVPF
ncbi:acyloxyacyl hydrolase [Yoonia sp. MH D7]